MFQRLRPVRDCAMNSGEHRKEGLGAVVLYNAIATVWAQPCFLYPWAPNIFYTGSRQWWTVWKTFRVEYPALQKSSRWDVGKMEMLKHCKNIGEYGAPKLSICITSSIRQIFVEFVISGSTSQHFYQSFNKLSGINMNRNDSRFHP